MKTAKPYLIGDILVLSLVYLIIQHETITQLDQQNAKLRNDLKRAATQKVTGGAFRLGGG